jgi:hypothetical protein
MKNPYLGYNPVFESLVQQAKKYTNVHINEDVIKYEGKKSQEYLKILIGTINDKIVKFTTSIPQKDLRNIVLGEIGEGYKTLLTSTPASIDDLLTSMNDLLEKAYTQVAASSYKDKLVPIYDKVKEGMGFLMKAYENLKKKYPSEMSNPESLKNAKKYLDASITSFNNTLEGLKKEG